MTDETRNSRRPTPARVPPTDADRRKFLLASLVTAPLLVTLTARPAWAHTGGSLGTYASATTAPTGGTTTTGTTGRGGGRGRGGG